MRRTLLSTVALVAGITLTACNDVPTQPTRVTPPPQSPPRQSPIVRAITFGEAITDRIDASTPTCTIGGAGSPCRQFLVTAPADGTLVVEISWHEDLMTLLLKIEEFEFVPVRRSALIGRFTTTAGQSYRLTVGAKQDMFEDVVGGQFTLTTRMAR